MIICFVVGVILIGLSISGFLFVSKAKKEDQEAAKIELLAMSRESRGRNESEMAFSVRKADAESAARGDNDEIWWTIPKTICWVILAVGIILVVTAIWSKFSH
ncbi:MAG: hypothetical protein WCI52_00760 [bacterium]